MLARWLSGWGVSRTEAAQADLLYVSAVGQARRPDFYLVLGVPDTVAGRFELLSIHAHLLLRRLGQLGEPAEGLAQALFDRFADDLAANMREMGVGDLSVSRRLRFLGEGWMGRAAAYHAALDAEDQEPRLCAALERNLGAAGGHPDLPAIALYMIRANGLLAGCDLACLRQGTGLWPAPAEAP